MDSKTKKVIRILKAGGIGVMPTDTIYGLVGSVFSKSAIKKIYEIKKRDKKKKLIVLVSSIEDLKKFNIKLALPQREELNKFWPHSAKAMRGKPVPVSIIINGIAFRLPNKKSLIEILKKTGPLVAPSANPEGLPPAKNIKEAKKYFGEKVDLYRSGGLLKSSPSLLIELEKSGKVKVLRGIIKSNASRRKK